MPFPAGTFTGSGGDMSVSMVLSEKWPVLGRHEQALAWLQVCAVAKLPRDARLATARSTQRSRRAPRPDPTRCRSSGCRAVQTAGLRGCGRAVRDARARSRRLALSASSDRRLTALAPAAPSVAGSLAATMTAARGSGWRWINDRWTRARAATEKMVISAARARISARAWWTRWRRRATSRRWASASAVVPLTSG